MRLGDMLRGLAVVMHRVRRMAVSGLCVMARLFVAAAFVMLGGFTMVSSGVLVMLCGGAVVLCAFVTGH